MWIIVLQKISQKKIHSIKAVLRLDSIELKQVTKILKIKYQKVSTHFLVKKLFLTCLFCFLLHFEGNPRLDFAFPTNFTASARNLVRFILAVSLTFFQNLDKNWSGLVQLFYLPFSRQVLNRWLDTAFIVLAIWSGWLEIVH